MCKKTERNKILKPLRLAIALAGVLLWIVLMLVNPVAVDAAPQHGFGRDSGRIQPILENDFHTNQWERFHPSYHFTSGMNYRYDLGQPTAFSGFVPVNVYSVNFRRDANVSLRPPSYGTFSGIFPTDPSNRFFPQPVNPNFHMPIELTDPNAISHFDTLQMGVNSQPTGNPMDFQQNVTTGEFLAPTSMRD
jgi:hypothetical protein